MQENLTPSTSAPLLNDKFTQKNNYWAKEFVVPGADKSSSTIEQEVAKNNSPTQVVRSRPSNNREGRAVRDEQSPGKDNYNQNLIFLLQGSQQEASGAGQVREEGHRGGHGGQDQLHKVRHAVPTEEHVQLEQQNQLGDTVLQEGTSDGLHLQGEQHQEVHQEGGGDDQVHCNGLGKEHHQAGQAGSPGVGRVGHIRLVNGKEVVQLRKRRGFSTDGLVQMRIRNFVKSFPNLMKGGGGGDCLAKCNGITADRKRKYDSNFSSSEVKRKK